MHLKQENLDIPSYLLFDSELVQIGLFDCPSSHPRFHNTGPERQFLVVFPRLSVRIHHEHEEPVIASQQIITLYNQGQEYRRESLSGNGDQSIWFRFQQREVMEALRAAGRLHGNAERRPFAWTHSSCDAQTYLMQRSLARELFCAESLDPLQVCETSMTLLYRAVVGAQPSSGISFKGQPESNTRARHASLVRRCEVLLATRYDESLSLEMIAQELFTSPFHLSRVFRMQTGQSIHQYMMQLRLRGAVDRMIDAPRQRLTDISMELGFSTPSHFSHNFRQQFGLTPRQFMH